jgi:hypothetical protein
MKATPPGKSEKAGSKAVLPLRAPKDPLEARSVLDLRVPDVNDVLVLHGPDDRWEVRLRGAAWPFRSYAFEEAALENGRDFAKLWRCAVVVIDRAGRVRLRESYADAA